VISIIIPTYNERENAPKLVNQIINILNNKYDFEIVIVDDNSPDGTAEEIKKINDARIRILSKKKEGFGKAVIHGFKNAKGDILMLIDGDFSHQPSDIPALIEEVLSGDCDMCSGSRYMPGGKIVGWNLYRKVISRTANFISKTFLGINVTDVTCGFWAFKKDLLKSIDIDSFSTKGYVFISEFWTEVIKNNFKIKEIPITFINRREGESKLNLKKEAVEYLKAVWQMRKK